MKSSDTSQKYLCPGNKQNQLIHLSIEVGVDEATSKINQSDLIMAEDERLRWGHNNAQNEAHTIALLSSFRILHNFVSLHSPTDGLILLNFRLCGLCRRWLSRHGRLLDAQLVLHSNSDPHAGCGCRCGGEWREHAGVAGGWARVQGWM